MAALPPVVGAIKLTFRQSQGNNTNILNRLYYHYTGTAMNVTQLQNFVASCHDEYVAHLLPQLPTVFFLQETMGVDLSSDTSPEYGFNLSKGGALAGNPLPPSECALINYQVNRRYRGGHPRWYQSGLEDINVDLNGQLVQPWAGNYKTAHDAFLNAIPTHIWSGATALQHCNISYFKGFTVHTKPGGRTENIPTPRATPVVDIVVGTTLHGKVASQRRRIGLP